MTTYGNKQEPGITTDLTSSAAVPTSGEAPSNPGYVGQADLENANDPADTGKVYQVTRASRAVDWFGPMESSLLTNAVVDALNEGAYPVYAVATPEETVSGEDHSGAATTTVSTDKVPIREDALTTDVTLDGTDLNVTRLDSRMVRRLLRLSSVRRHSLVLVALRSIVGFQRTSRLMRS